MKSMLRFWSNLGNISFTHIFLASASELVIIFLRMSIMRPLMARSWNLTMIEINLPAITLEMMGSVFLPI